MRNQIIIEKGRTIIQKIEAAFKMLDRIDPPIHLNPMTWSEVVKLREGILDALAIIEQADIEG